MGSIRVVRGGDIPTAPAAVSTEKWTRRIIDVDDRITINVARNEPNAVSGWHHHGANTGCVYVVQGRLRVEWGPGGREKAELAAGDFYVIQPDTIHREVNPGAEDQVLIAFVSGSGPKFINVGQPVREGASIQEIGSIRTFRSRDIPAGPSSHGMTRKMADVNELVSLAEARNEPQTVSGWHHHTEHTMCVYVVKGRIHLDWGPRGNESADLAAGDFYIIYPNTIHREGNPGSEAQLIVGFALGRGARVVNVDEPEP